MPSDVTALLVSDREREYTVGLLRGHWLSGRLTAEEFESRVEEAWSARSSEDLWHALRMLPAESPPVVRKPASSGNAVASLVLGLLALCFLLFTLGFAFPIALPLAVTAWALGRDARRSGTKARGTAVAGEVAGVVGTTLCVLFLVGCAVLVTSV